MGTIPLFMHNGGVVAKGNLSWFCSYLSGVYGSAYMQKVRDKYSLLPKRVKKNDVKNSPLNI